MKGAQRDAFPRIARYRSKSALKLMELDDRFQLFSPSRYAATGVVDLCAAPGGFTQVALQRLPLVQDLSVPSQEQNNSAAPHQNRRLTRCVAVDAQSIAAFERDTPCSSGSAVTLRADVLRGQPYILKRVSDTFCIPRPTDTWRSRSRVDLECRGALPNRPSAIRPLVLPTIVLHDGVHVAGGGGNGNSTRELSILFRQNVMAMAALRFATRLFLHVEQLCKGGMIEALVGESGGGEGEAAPDDRRCDTLFDCFTFVTKLHISPHWEAELQPAMSRFFERVSSPVRLESSPHGSLERFVVARGWRQAMTSTPPQQRPDRPGSFVMHPTAADVTSGCRPFYHCVQCTRDVQEPCGRCCGATVDGGRVAIGALP